MPADPEYWRAISRQFQPCKFDVNGGCRLGGRRFDPCDGLRFGEKRADLPAQLVLEDIDLPPGIEDAEIELIGHGRVLLQQRALIRAEALVDVVAELHV